MSIQLPKNWYPVSSGDALVYLRHLLGAAKYDTGPKRTHFLVGPATGSQGQNVTISQCLSNWFPLFVYPDPVEHGSEGPVSHLPIHNIFLDNIQSLKWHSV